MKTHHLIQSADQLPGRTICGTMLKVAALQTGKNSLRLGAGRLFMSLILMLAMQGLAWGVDTGLKSPTSGANVNSVSNYANAYTSNNSRATFDAQYDAASYQTFSLTATDGASGVIPVGAIINGIQVQLEGQDENSGDRNLDISLTWNNGTNYTSTIRMTQFDNSNDELQTVGGSTNLWGRTWTETELRNANFGIKCYVPNTGTNDINIDHLQVRIYYTVPPSITDFSPTNGCQGATGIVINGTNLDGAISATIGGTAATITGNTETTVTVTVGSGTTGTVAVTTPGGTATSAATFTVNANNTVGAPSSSPTPCINTVMTSITHTTTGATGIGTATGLPAGVTAAWASNTITISGTPMASGTFNYSIPLSGGCGSVINATGTIIVNPSPTASVSGKFNVTCFGANDGKIEVTAIDGTGPYTFSVETPENFLPPTGTNLRLFEDLLPNVAYRIKVKDHNGCHSK